MRQEHGGKGKKEALEKQDIPPQNDPTHYLRGGKESRNKNIRIWDQKLEMVALPDEKRISQRKDRSPQRLSWKEKGGLGIHHSTFTLLSGGKAREKSHGKVRSGKGVGEIFKILSVHREESS